MYIFWFLHQTTTPEISFFSPSRCISFDSYIKPQHLEESPCTWWVVYLLIPTSNHNCGKCVPCQNTLYIFWFLHQTTTQCIKSTTKFSCISFDSYIKPQLQRSLSSLLLVVYLLIPTSNHNRGTLNRKVFRLYIFWFLHQTTTMLRVKHAHKGCISFDSYIKPQPIDLKVLISSVYQSLFLIRNGE